MNTSNTYKITLGICLMATASLPAMSVAAGFSFNKIVDTATPRPDGGFFDIANDIANPAIDGSRLVFLAAPNANPSAWSANADGTGLVKLADLNTPVPGGVGNFTNLSHVGAPLIKNGIVVISGRDSNTTLHFSIHAGLYQVPAQGGPIAKIVDYHDLIPGQGTETFQGWGDTSSGQRSFSVDGGRVAFFGVNFNSNGGTFLANLAGVEPIKPIAVDFNNFRCPNDAGGNVFMLNGFIYPSLSGHNLSFWGNGVFDPSTGSNKVFRATDTGLFGCEYVGSSLFPLAGEPVATQHTRYHAPGIQVDGDIIVFGADDSQPFDSTSHYFRGLWAVCADGSSTDINPDGTPDGTLATPTCGLPKQVPPLGIPFSPFTPIVTSTSSLPGLTGVINPNSFAFAFNQGQVLFRAFDEATPTAHEGLYLAKLSDHSLIKVIATGDSLDGKVVSALGDPGPGALSGNNLVFTAKFTDLSRGVYSAVQQTCATDVSQGLAVARSGFRLNRSTGHYVQTLTLTNNSASPITGPIALVLRNLSANATLANKSGDTACLAPSGAPFLTLNPPGNVLGIGGSIAGQLDFTHSGNQTILYTTQIGAGNAP